MFYHRVLKDSESGHESAISLLNHACCVGGGGMIYKGSSGTRNGLYEREREPRKYDKTETNAREYDNNMNNPRLRLQLRFPPPEWYSF